MSQQIILTGNVAGDGTGTPIRTAFQFINNNFTELYSIAGNSGNITTNTLTANVGNFVTLSVSDDSTFDGNITVVGNISVGDKLFIGNLVVDNNATVIGNLNVTGNMVGNMMGNMVGNVTGNVTGNLFGNMMGNMFGNTVGNSTTATNLYGPVALPNGTTATTQAMNDNSTLLATDQFVQETVANSVVSFNTRIGHVSLSSLDVTGALTYTPLNKAGDTMSGNLNMNGSSITHLVMPLSPTSTDAANKGYVDSVAVGLIWQNPVTLINLIGNSSTPQFIANIIADAYIVDTGGNVGIWSSFAVGDIVQYQDTNWIKVTTSALDDFFVIGGQTTLPTPTPPVGAAAAYQNYFCKITGGSPGNWTYTFTAPVGGYATFVQEPLAYYYGSAFTYSSGLGQWVAFSKSLGTVAGDGLVSIGNVLDVVLENSSNLVFSANNKIDLAQTGVTPGTYTQLTVDAYGRITTAANVSVFGTDLTVNGITVGQGPGGTGNTVFGAGAMPYNTAANYNIAVGFGAMTNTTAGEFNVGVGLYALNNCVGYNNTGLGYSAGSNISTGTSNLLLGAGAGISLTTENFNVVVGGASGGSITGTDRNIILSDGAGTVRLQINQAGVINFTGSAVQLNGVSVTGLATDAFNNSWGGTYALASMVETGSATDNTALGYNALHSLVTGMHNIAIGSNAGANELGSYKLYIDGTGTGTSTPLIYGQFDSTGGFAGNVQINGNLTVAGNINAYNTNLTGDVTSVSNLTTLATVNATPGTFGNATNIPHITVNAKGLITSASNVAVLIPSGAIQLIGDATGTGTTGANTTVTFNTVNSNVGEFGNATYIPQLTVNAKGLVTAAANVAISFPTTAITKPYYDNTSAMATDQFVQTVVQSIMAYLPLSGITGGTYSFASQGTAANITIHTTGGTITSYSAILTGGIGYKVGDLITIQGGNHDSVLRVLTLSGSAISSLEILYGGTGYTNGVSSGADATTSFVYTISLSGTLVSDATVVLTNGTYLTQSNQFIVCNNTTGAYNVIFKVSNSSDTAIGVGIIIPQGTGNYSGIEIQTDGVTDVWATNAPNLTGDATTANTVITLATVNSNTGQFGNATYIPQYTVNAKGLITASANVAIGTLNQNTTGSANNASYLGGQAAANYLVSGGALGTPISGAATNLTGTAAGLTAGNVTNNANLTGPITSVGNATLVAAQTGTGNVFVMNTSPTITSGTITGGAISNVAIDGTATTIANVTISCSTIKLREGVWTTGNISPVSDTTDIFTANNIPDGATTITAPSYSTAPTQGQGLILRIRDNGSPTSLAWAAASGGYRAIGVTLPVTTIANKILYIACLYNSTDNYWDVVSVLEQ